MYQFTQDQLAALLGGTIDSYLEHREQHGYSDESARRAAIGEALESLDGDYEAAIRDIIDAAA